MRLCAIVPWRFLSETDPQPCAANRAPRLHACVTLVPKSTLPMPNLQAKEVEGVEAASSVSARPTTLPTGYLPTLDGWRAIAILWVFEGHSRPWKFGPISNAWVRATGSHGVQLFFALSGFLICTRLLRQEDRFGSISMRSFYIRRLFRIQPAALTFLFVVALLTLFGAIPAFWSGLAGAVLMVRNIWPLRLEAGYWYTSHFWSLAVEEHFYLLLPAFLFFVRRKRLWIMTLSLCLLEIWRMLVLRTPALHRGLGWQLTQRTDMAIDGILLGCLFAIAITHARVLHMATRWLRPWLAVLFAVVVLFELERHRSSVVQSGIIFIYPVLIVATVLHPRSILGCLLELPPVRYIGRISYSLYLWQQLFFNPDEVPAPHSLHAHVFLCWCATFACAIASYYLIETPFIRRGHAIAKRFDAGASVQRTQLS